MKLLLNQKILDFVLVVLFVIGTCAVIFAHERSFAREWACGFNGFCPTFRNADAWFKIAYDMGIGCLTSVFFYVLLVRIPEAQRRIRIRRSLSAQYVAFKRDLIAQIVGTADGSYDVDIIDRLLDRNQFRDYFKEAVSNDQERWHRFLNKLDNFHVRQLVTIMEIFRDEIQFVLNNVYIPSDQPFEFFKRLSNAIYLQKDLNQDYDDVKQLSKFLWSLMTGWDWVEGYRERDVVQDMIDAI